METQEEKQPDRIPLEAPNIRTPLNDEPILDILASRATKDIREKKPKDLSANDKAILELLKELTPGELLKKNFIERTVPICEGLDTTVRTLVLKQTEAIAHDVSRYQQQRELEKGSDGIERVVWQPTDDQIRAYATKRALCEGIITMGNFEIAKMALPERLAFFEDTDTHLLNAAYRIMQKLYTAVGLLFPSDNQKELLQTLKKVWAPHP